MAEMMISFQQLSTDIKVYQERQKFYVYMDWETADYFLLKTATYVLSLIIGDIHTTIEQEDLSVRYGFYPRKWVNFRLKYHGVEDIKELKWFLSTVELKQRLYFLELARQDNEGIMKMNYGILEGTKEESKKDQR